MRKYLRNFKTTLIVSIIGILSCLMISSNAFAGAYFTDDMEATTKWTEDSPWATTTSEFHEGTTSYTDSPEGAYSDNTTAALTMKDPIDLSSANNPKLVFWHKYQFETDWDHGRVDISTDGGTTWIETPLQSYTGLSGWKREQIDLSPYKVNSVKIRFRMDTDNRITYDGWYIDDVNISELPNPVLNLVVTQSSTAPSTALDLSWTQNIDDDFASYKIYRSEDSGVNTDSTLLDTITDQSTTTYSDTGLTPETTYYYKAYVYNDYDLAAGSAEVSETTSAAEFDYPFFDNMEGSVSAWTNDSPWDVVALADGDNYSSTGISKVWTDSPDSSYAANEDTSLQMTIDLGTATMPVLSFWHKYTLNTDSDYVYIEIQEDGSVDWKRIYFATGTQASWVEERVDLSNYAGKKMHIRFRLISDDNGIQSNGWLIDDVRIDETEGIVFGFPFVDNMDSETSSDNWHSSSWAFVSPGHSGSNAFTDSPAGNYGALVDSTLIMSNVIDLSTAVHPLLTFYHKYEIINYSSNTWSAGCTNSYGTELDYGRVYLSTDKGQSGTWTQLSTFKGSLSSWTREQIDLSDWAGLPDIRIKFVMNDNNGVGGCTNRLTGWSIDDVIIEDAPVEVTLELNSTSMNTVSMSWSENTDEDFDRYELYRSTSEEVTRNDTLIDTIADQSTTSYTDTVSMVQPETYYYRMWVIDTSGDISWSSNVIHATYTVPDNTYPFVEDGEGGTEKWSWGSPWSLKTLSAPESYSGSISTVWTDSPESNYPANADTSLTTFVDLSGSSNPVLIFWHRYSLEENKDFLKLEVSINDGQTWTPLRSFTGTETTWNRERVDMTSYAGQANLGLRFHLTSDEANQQDGWYMDDLKLVEEAVQASYPFFDDMENGIVPWFYDTPWGLVALSAAESYTDSASIVWTDSPEGSYAADEDTWLKLTIDLGSADMPVLTFWQKYAIEENTDFGYIEVREVGSEPWQRIYFVTGTSSWFQDRIDLSSYAGKQMEIRFRMISDSNIQSNGWFIDDIRIDETESTSLSYPFEDNMDGSSTANNWHSSSWALVADSHSGSSSFTDSPQGNYGEVTNSDLVMASTIDLSESVHPQLSFYHKYEIINYSSNTWSAGCTDSYGTELDYGRVYLSTDKGQPGTWTQLISFKGSNSNWLYTQIDLSDYAGLANVRIMFRMNDNNGVGGCSNRLAGWTIDDVVIEEGPVDSELSITSSSMNSITLSWTANQDNDFSRYEIYRSPNAGISRSDSTLVQTITSQAETTYTDTVSLVQPGTYYYKMWVYDTDGNISLGSNEVQAVYTAPVNIYPFSEDGEGGSGKWSWGSPWGLVELAPSESYSGFTSTVWTDSPDANYASNTNTSLSMFINLSGTSMPVLTFWHKYSLEDGNDYLNIEVSEDDGETWTNLRSITGTETTWNQERIDLSAFAGNANLGFRFRLESNDTTQKDGWYMDDLVLREEAIQANYPFYDDMESGIIPWFYGSPWGLKVLTEAESHSGSVSTVWSDSPVGSYRAGEDTSLQITVDLGSANMPVLTFWQKHALEENSDHGYIEVKEVGGQSWSRIYFITGTSPAWVKEMVELSNYAGKQIQIRFRLIADSNDIQSDGWLIDDLSIDETTTASLPYPFSDDMDGTYTVDNWHTSSWELVSDSNSGAYAYTDSPRGNYGSVTNSDLVMASTIDLSGAQHPQLSFYHKYETINYSSNTWSAGCSNSYGTELDYVRVYLSTYNGQPGTWTELKSFKGSLSAWTLETIDLSNWTGLPNVRIMFRMNDNNGVGGCSNMLAGWTIDDVRIGEDESIPSYIQKVSGDGQEGQTGMALTDPLEVKVYDSDSLPRSGIAVVFEVIGGGGTFEGGVTAYTATSDANGLAYTTLTLGETAGSNSVSATIKDSDPVQSVTFTAEGYSTGQAKNLSKVSGNNQVNTVNTALDNPIIVKITDILDDVVPDIVATFNVISGDGTLTGGVTSYTATTNTSGLASATLTLGANTGATVVTVNATGVTPVSFTAHAVLSGGTLGDDDGDGMPNSWEDTYELNSQDASDGSADADSDELDNYHEYTLGTLPDDNDTDNDGMPDGWEVQYGLDPNDASDADNDNDDDNTSNLAEYQGGTIPVFPKHFEVADTTSASMDFYGLVTIDGVPAAVGDEVAVLDPDGVVCGKYRVDTEGEYGFMHVYGDDSGTSEVDEGAETGDQLTFRIWDASAGAELEATPNVISGDDPPAWTKDSIANVDLNGAGTLTIPLRAGWNLISFAIKSCFYIDGVSGYADGAPTEPMLPGTVYLKKNSISEIFTSIAGKYDVIRSFDAKGAHTYDPALPTFSDLKYVAGGYGYWIKMNADGNLVLTGIRAVPEDTLDLHSGWNLIGYWHTGVQHIGTAPLVDFPSGVTQFAEVNDIDDILAAISGNYAVIRSYDIDGAHTYDPMLGSFNDLDYLGPGYGIWIKMKTVDELSY